MLNVAVLAVGDRLIYPNQGLCTVTEIRAEKVAGVELTLVTLLMNKTGALVKVPPQKLVKNGVRRVSSRDEVNAVLSYLIADTRKTSLNWKQRAKDNAARLVDGGLRGLAQIVKELQELSELRPLPLKERELYDDARHLLVEELVAACGVQGADAEDMFDVALFAPGRDRPVRVAAEFEGELDEDEQLLLAAQAEQPDPDKTDPTGQPRQSVAAPKVAAPPPAVAPPLRRKRGRPPKPPSEITEPAAAPRKRRAPPK